MPGPECDRYLLHPSRAPPAYHRALWLSNQDPDTESTGHRVDVDSVPGPIRPCRVSSLCKCPVSTTGLFPRVLCQRCVREPWVCCLCSEFVVSVFIKCRRVRAVGGYDPLRDFPPVDGRYSSTEGGSNWGLVCYTLLSSGDPLECVSMGSFSVCVSSGLKGHHGGSG